MKQKLFEQPEFPALERLKKTSILFIKQVIALFVLSVLILFVEKGYGYHILNIQESALVLIIEALIYHLIYFIKVLPFLFLLFLLIHYTLYNKRLVRVLTFSLFSVYLLVDLLLIKYYFTTKQLLGEGFFKPEFVNYSNIFGFNPIWFFLILVVLVALWFALDFTKNITFVDATYAFGLLIIGVLLLFFRVSALPTEKDKGTTYMLKVSKQAHFVEMSYPYLFEDEPVLDIYEDNYLD